MYIIVNVIVSLLLCAVSCNNISKKSQDCKSEAFQKVFLEFSITKIKTNVVYVSLSEVAGSPSVRFDLMEEDHDLRKYIESKKDKLMVDCLSQGDKIEYLYISTYRDNYIERDLQLLEAKKMAEKMIKDFDLNPEIDQFVPKWLPKRY